MVEENNSMMTTVTDLTPSNIKSSQVNLVGLSKYAIRNSFHKTLSVLKFIIISQKNVLKT